MPGRLTEEQRTWCGTRKRRPRFVGVPTDRGWGPVPVLYARNGLAVTPGFSKLLGRYVVTHLRSGYQITWRHSLVEARQSVQRLLAAGRWSRDAVDVALDSKLQAAVKAERSMEEEQ